MKEITPLARTIRNFAQATYRVIKSKHVLPFVYEAHSGPLHLYCKWKIVYRKLEVNCYLST